MDIVEKLRNLSNPYYPITPRIKSSEFIGREDALNQLRIILEEYQNTFKLKNMFIIGDKSVGKSTLLNRFQQIFTDYNFFVHEIVLPRNDTSPIDEFEIFKDFIDDLFIKFSPPEGSFLDSTQQEIWFSLTQDKYDHHSNFTQRKLGFATKYASRKRGISEALSYKMIEKDFEVITDSLFVKDTEINGIAFLIDEFQELRRNPLLMDFFRMLSENIPGIIIIGAGIPGMFNNPSFEKFTRVSIPCYLKGLSRNEAMDLIFKPVENALKIPRFDIKQYFDFNSTTDIVKRSEGNPLHIRILCAKMFEQFQITPMMKILQLNRDVMDRVMDYYSTISEKSNKIKLSLESCTKDQLEAFSRLYYYEGFSIRSSIMASLAFNSVQNDAIDAIRQKIMNDFNEIKDLELFEFSENVNRLEVLQEKSKDSLAYIEYKFIGDPIDKLYVSYFYEDLTGNSLLHHSSKGFDDFLALKLAATLPDKILADKIPQDIIDRQRLFKSRPDYGPDNITQEAILDDFNALAETSISDEENKAKMKIILDIAKKHKLAYAAIIASMLDYEGYYLLITNVNIKGKNRFIFNYLPVKGGIENITNITEQISANETFANASLHEYMITINWMYLYFMPKESLRKIYYLDVKSDHDKMFDAVRRRDFKSAADLAERLYALDVKMKKDQLIVHVEAMNNYAFCLINILAIDSAIEELIKIQDKYIISKVNIAYAYYLKGDWEESVTILKKLSKKLSKQDSVSFMHLAILHDKLSNEHKIVENVSLINVILWNLALINAKYVENKAIAFGFYSKVKNTGDEELIHKRVKNWIDYYRNETTKAINGSKALLDDCSKVDYLCKDITEDLKIFENTL
jgi:hypothetical protein